MTKPINTRQKAINFRKLGYSYSMIGKKLGLSKSTLSDWLREISFTPNKKLLDRIGNARMRSAQSKQKNRRDDIEKMKRIAQKEVGTLSQRDLLMLGIGIYLGEGSKLYECVRIINSDPQIIQLSLKWFRDICGLKNKNFRPAIHIYPDNDKSAALTFWSKTTKIPRSQFGKMQIDKRASKSKKKKGKLPYGTLHLYVKSCGEKKFGRSLHRKIMGWIYAVFNQANV